MVHVHISGGNLLPSLPAYYTISQISTSPTEIKQIYKIVACTWKECDGICRKNTKNSKIYFNRISIVKYLLRRALSNY